MAWPPAAESARASHGVSRTAVLALLAALVRGASSDAAPADAPGASVALPDGFVHVEDVVPGVVVDLRYAGPANFVGVPIDGYLAPRPILTREAASALAGVQNDLRAFGLALEIYDAYRPERAVAHFVRWAGDLSDQRTKATFYPGVAKQDLFREGYIAARSSHSRGSTVDVTLVSRTDGAELDMGSPFDFFGPVSWPTDTSVAASARAHRLLLRSLMLRHGFEPYPQEWWHFTLRDEPFPDRSFDFPVQ